ncbi:MAG: cell wall hydrolase [Pseudomonadota bacterium]
MTFPSFGRAGLFIALSVVTGAAMVDLSDKEPAIAATVPVKYDMAPALSLAMINEGNHTARNVPTAAEREASDPFLMLADLGIDADPIREAVDLLDLDTASLEVAVIADPIEDQVVPAASKRCLAQAIYYEARNQSTAGQMAIADVILNRVDNRFYPDNICDVVYQGSQRVTGCQFTFTCDGSMTKPVDVAAMKDAQVLADAVLSGLRVELSRGALNYHADYVDPYWAGSLHKTAVVDDHLFYTPVRYAQLAGVGSVGQ